jgi:mannosyltransferase OCH1-like enzyme
MEYARSSQLFILVCFSFVVEEMLDLFLCCGLVLRRMRGTAIRLCRRVLSLARTHPLSAIASLFILYTLFVPVRDAWRFTSALDEHSLSLDDLLPHPRANRTSIPRVIHRTYKTADIPPKWLKSYENCQILHPNYTHYFWTDESSRELIKTDFEWFLPTYDSYPFTIQRVDAARYFFLWKFGGVYIDMDVSCRSSLDPLLNHSAWLPRTWPYGISNDVMASVPSHPLMVKAALSLYDHNSNYGSKYITVFFTTGPMFLNGILAAWFRAVREGHVPVTTNHSIAVLPPMFYSRSEHSFFEHGHGSTWHGYDVAVVLWIYRHLIGLCVAGLGVAIVLRIWKRAKQHRKSKHWSS